ncbi:MAG: hypothetical protein EU530_07095 [Promethearchaeota archaeon]|nr:MAG: hypothetical protein EU530_07095 [Candidatus Lokiarchaeota archaeon]
MTYDVKYIRSSKIKDLFKVNKQSIRISAEAKDMVYKFLDDKVKEGVDEILNKLPRKTKGDSKGELKRITIFPSDFE